MQTSGQRVTCDWPYIPATWFRLPSSDVVRTEPFLHWPRYMCCTYTLVGHGVLSGNCRCRMVQTTSHIVNECPVSKLHDGGLERPHSAGNVRVTVSSHLGMNIPSIFTEKFTEKQLIKTLIGSFRCTWVSSYGLLMISMKVKIFGRNSDESSYEIMRTCLIAKSASKPLNDFTIHISHRNNWKALTRVHTNYFGNIFIRP